MVLARVWQVRGLRRAGRRAGEVAEKKQKGHKKACGTLWVLARSEGAAASGSKFFTAKHLQSPSLIVLYLVLLSHAPV